MGIILFSKRTLRRDPPYLYMQNKGNSASDMRAKQSQNPMVGAGDLEDFHREL